MEIRKKQDRGHKKQETKERRKERREEEGKEGWRTNIGRKKRKCIDNFVSTVCSFRPLERENTDPGNKLGVLLPAA